MTPPPVFRRFNDFAGIETLGDLWSLQRDGRTVRLVLTTHSLGHELRLIVGLKFVRSQVCKTPDQIFDVSEAWKAEAIGKGWTR